MDNLWGSLSQRVEAQLGRPLPERPPDDVADPEFLALLNQLRQADPDLAEEVINAYTGTSERLPSEAEAASERRRQQVHRHLFSRFLRPDGLRTGRVRLNLRKTLNWIGAAVAVFIIIWSLIPNSAPVSAPAPRTTPAVSQTVTQLTPPSTAPAVSASQAPTPALSPIPPVAPSAAAPRVPPLAVSPPGFPPPMPDGDWSGLGGPPPPMPGVAATTASQVVVFEASRAQQEPISPVVYLREESQPGAQQPQVVVHASPNGTVSTQSPALVVVYDASAARSSAGTAAMAPPAAPETPAQAAAPAAPRGQLLEVRLVAPVAVTSSGGATPALAEIAQGPLQGALLVGQATRSPEGLVLIQFNAVIGKDGKEQPFRGAAYDAQVGRLGVAGQVSTMMPGAASALLAATMQSVSDYFEARAQQQQVTITNGFLTVTQRAPSFWDGLASAVARAFAPSAQSTMGPTVVARLDRGQTLTILVM